MDTTANLTDQNCLGCLSNAHFSRLAMHPSMALLSGMEAQPTSKPTLPNTHDIGTTVQGNITALLGH